MKTETKTEAKPLYRERDGVCSRGLLFLGQKDLAFFDLATAIKYANMFRHYYGLDAADIHGGEPTEYEWIVPLVEHCSRIGLRPTLISSGQGDIARILAIEDAGLDDWLISIHGGTAESHDAILGNAGSFEKLIASLDLVGRPVRFSTTIQRKNLGALPIDLLLDRPPTVWNPTVLPGEFDPIAEGVTNGEAAEALAPAIERLEAAGWEVNVRYFPLCVAEQYGFAENVSGFYQIPFDPWEWRLNVTTRRPLEAIARDGGWYESERIRAAESVRSRANDVCDPCSMRPICDGPTNQYQKAIGLEELIPYTGEPITDPLHFQNRRGLRR